MKFFAIADVVAGGAGVLVSEPVLEVEDVDALLAGPGGGGEPGGQCRRGMLDGVGGVSPDKRPAPRSDAGRAG
jgi:hypothetical protein